MPAALLLDVSLSGPCDARLGDAGCAARLTARPCVLAPKPAALLLDVSLSGAGWANATELTATSAPARRRIDFMMIVSADLGWVLNSDQLGRGFAFASAATAAAAMWPVERLGFAPLSQGLHDPREKAALLLGPINRCSQRFEDIAQVVRILFDNRIAAAAPHVAMRANVL
jgi:hypothetical protein